jgi:ABC-type multidrug transport system fused ATPase/permease subunit
MAFRSVGSLAHRSSGDVAHMQEFLARFVPEAIASVIQIVLVTLAILWLQPAVALVGLVLVPAIWLLMERINRRVRGLARSSQQQSESALTRLIEGVAGYIDLVAAGRFSRAADEYDAALDGLRRTAIRTTLTSALAALIPSLAFMAITFGYYFFVVGEQQVLGDVAALGEIMTFVGLLSVARMPLMSLARFLTEAAVAAPSFHEVRRLLEAPEVIEPSRGAEIGGSAIEFKDVSFAYGPQFPKILDGVDFTVPEGSFTAVVGETGSGKTTLFHLLLRLLEPGDGEIRIGGTPLRDVSLEDLRSHVGFIPQSPFLFDATIRENVAIALPKGEVDSGAMARAVEMAQLAPVIEKRAAQGGLDAPVGAGGASLSGGERQRVALARVFLRDPRVIVCDEYTANIDNATARLIHEALAKAFAGRTRIVITHQLYTIRGADQILVLEHGRIAERGSHEELLAKGGLYREMWEVQRLS